MAQKKTSHAYAQALLELSTEPWLKGLRLANRRLREGDLMAQLENPAVSPEAKKELLKPVLAEVPPQVGAFVRTLVNEGELNKMDAITSEFETLVVRRSQYVLAHVRSAVPLTDGERKQLEENLGRRFGSNLEAEYEIDAALIGGVVVRIGDEVIDGSLAGKLATLRERLA
jgi:F-type H+-transporting ATPase subunit delta